MQGRNRRVVATLRGSLQIGDGFLESTLLRVRQTLKGEGERVIGFQLQALSSELDRFVVAPREDQEHAPERVGPYRQRIEVDRSPDLPDVLVVPRLAREIRRVVQAG